MTFLAAAWPNASGSDSSSVVHDVVAVRTRPGRPFLPVEEAELGSALLLVARALVPPASGYVAVREFVGPFGVADLCAVEVGEDDFKSRVATGVPPLLNDVDVRIISALSPSKSRRVDDVCIRSGLRADLVERRVSVLRRIGAIDVTSKQRLVKQSSLRPLGRVHAIECKVSDWRRGMVQSNNYSLWADSSTLLLGRLPADEEKLRRHASELGIGLAVGACLIRRPRRRRHDVWRRLWTSEHFLAALTTQ